MSHRRVLPATLVIVGLLWACGPGAEAPSADEILWDTWGVPHIYGTTESAAFRGMGWAQMESHGDLVLRLYGEARGRAAEYWGEDYRSFVGGPAPASDRYVRTMGVPRRAAEWAGEETPQMQENLAAFVDGMNRYAQSFPERIAEDAQVVLPVTVEDVMAHAHRALHFVFVSSPNVVQQARRVLATRTAAGVEDPRSGAEAPGSNTWAIAPSRSASGNAMLVANPHLPWQDLFLFYEQHVVGPGFDAYGATLVGLPGIAIGFNQRLGWSHTVNTYDGVDLFTLTLDGEGYRFGDQVRPFETRSDTVLVRDGSGALRADVFEVKSSVHGPVIAEGDGRAVAVRVAGIDRPRPISQWWAMARSSSLEEFESALAGLQIPMFNVMYADADGHILYVFNGAVPRRGGGDFQSWRGAVDGSDPETFWDSYHAYEELPRILDPEIGWLQNANDPPWTATVPQVLDPEDFPPYMAPVFMGPRPQRSANILREDDSVTFEELAAYKHDTRVEMADRVLDELLEWAESSADERARDAAGVLAQWDRTVNADSRGAILFEEWIRRWTSGPSGWSNPWSEEAPANTPSGIADGPAAVAVLAEAAEEVASEFGSLDVPWGEVHRARRNGHSVPVSGGPGGPMGIFRVASFQSNGSGEREVVSGDSYYAAMEFTPEGPRARVLTAYGNATQPHSPHNGDQLELFSQQQMRPVWRTREEVEANLSQRVELPGNR
jgi:acyl-homoserine-lactone acylase